MLFTAGCDTDKPASWRDDTNEVTVHCGNSDLPDPSEYTGTAITISTWEDPRKGPGRAVIDSFEQEYDITVNVQLIDRDMYVETVAANIASGIAGDIFFENGTFPVSLSVMQPLDAAKLDLEDPKWNNLIIKNSTIDGHPYLVDTIANVWTQTDICVYNYHIFESNGITTPTQYYESGKWTFANFRKAAEEIVALGKGYSGAGILGDAALGAAGCSFFALRNGRMQVTVDDHLMDVMSFLSQMKADGIAEPGHDSFADGKQGMAITNCAALLSNGYFAKMNRDHIAATYLPVWSENEVNQVSSGIYRGWGLIEGAKNPVGAGFFLSHYLDAENYDLEEVFVNKSVADFFFQATGYYYVDMIYHYDSAMVKAAGMGELYQNTWSNHAPDKIKAYLASQKETMNEMCLKANEFIDGELQQLKTDRQN